MLYASWSIALLVCSVAVLFVNLVAARTALRILLFWDDSADTVRQIKLERETWLVSLLVQNGLVLQAGSLVLLVLAAEGFAGQLAGAMCATGTFWSNSYGAPLLAVRSLLVFSAGFWLLVNHLDNNSEFRPLLKLKYVLVLALLPLVATDVWLQWGFLSELKPDIITSCCGVIFGETDFSIGFTNLLVAPGTIGTVFYSIFLALIFCSLGTRTRVASGNNSWLIPDAVCSLLAVSFFIVSLFAVTFLFSPYIYETPAHRCPFDILQYHYGYIGFPIYFFLFTGSFAGMSLWPAAILGKGQGIGAAARRYRLQALRYAVVALSLFVSIVTWYPAVYLLGGDGR